MAHLETAIIGRNLDGENIAEILNIAKITSASAALTDTELMRKAEVDAADAVLQSDIDANTIRIAALEAMDEMQSETRAFTGTFVDNGDGTHTATLAHDFNSTALNFQLQESNGDGSYHFLIGTEVDVDLTDAAFVITTASPTIATKTLRIIASGVEIV